MKAELKSLHANETWELVALPAKRNAIRCRWVYKIKVDGDGNMGKYKARLVAKGFTQIPGIDFLEIYAPIASMNSIRILLYIGAVMDYEIHQMNVTCAYLNGILNVEIYMEQPVGFANAEDTPEPVNFQRRA
jgi:Reverse transcriptase (RNA-dependent DNA polymerase)